MARETYMDLMMEREKPLLEHGPEQDLKEPVIPSGVAGIDLKKRKRGVKKKKKKRR